MPERVLKKLQLISSFEIDIVPFGPVVVINH